jgi:hypothetical protein
VAKYGSYPPADGNYIEGKLIGTDISGAQPLGNTAEEILIEGSSNTVLGGMLDGAGNVIAFNHEAGVAVVGASCTGNLIHVNSIHSNGGLGIDLGGDGSTANDPGDPDTGPNNLQNFPVISRAEPGATTRVVASLNSTANSTFTLDFYVSSQADPSGFGEGERRLGSAIVTTDPGGNADFDVVLAAATVSGKVITANATDPHGNTSEFSNANVLTRLLTV